MVFSCLVKPLVPSLIEAPAGRRSALQRRRVAATSLIATALALCTTNVDAQALQNGEVVSEQQTPRSLHKKPAAIPLAEVIELYSVAAKNEDELAGPSMAPRFEWQALAEHRLRHSRNIRRVPGSLGFGVRQARLTSPRLFAYQHFGSGRLLSGAPSPS